MKSTEKNKHKLGSYLKAMGSLLTRPPISAREGETNEATTTFTIDNAGTYERLYFRSLSGPGLLQAGSDIPLLLSILQAMRWRRPIRVDGYISPTLRSNIEQYMEVFADLHPRFKPVKISAITTPLNPPTTSTMAPTRPRVGTFFSGGVDSFYSFLKHRDEITDLVFIHGFDVGLNEQRLRVQASAMGDRLSKALGVRFIEIETNARLIQKRWGRWGPHAHGLGLASVGRSLAPYLSKLYIPGSFSEQEQIPWGTHPDLDSLLGDESIEFVHDQTSAKRTDKIEFISRFPAALEALRVCYKNPNGAYNCCVCEKCLRTMTTLYAVGALEKATTFPLAITPAAIDALNISNEVTKTFARDNLRTLEKAGLVETPIYQAWARKTA